jgi:hypothetical protein
MAFSTKTGGSLISGLPPSVKEASMKIEITKRCRVRGVDCRPGTIVDTDYGTALDRIGAGLAKKYVEPPPSPPAEETEKQPEAEALVNLLDAEGPEDAADEDGSGKKKKKKGDKSHA